MADKLDIEIIGATQVAVDKETLKLIKKLAEEIQTLATDTSGLRPVDRLAKINEAAAKTKSIAKVALNK